MSDMNDDRNFGGSNFAEYIARERERLRAEREQVFSQQEELQRKLDAVNREFTAIEAYEGNTEEIAWLGSGWGRIHRCGG